MLGAYAAGIGGNAILPARGGAALKAGLSIFELAHYMGTSVEMIDRTYGHLARGSEELARAKLDAHAASDDVDRSGQDRATP